LENGLANKGMAQKENLFGLFIMDGITGMFTSLEIGK
jgi:hypothetical protein